MTVLCVLSAAILSTSIRRAAMSGDPRAPQERREQRRRVQALYDYYEKDCIKRGWRKVVVDVNGLGRKILWKGPKESWKYGAIIAMHGGGGTCSNFGSGLRIGKPMVEFSDVAVAKGFAVFSLDSTMGLATDAKGRSCGKRWDCVAQDDRPNVDLPFIETVIVETIPRLRPANSAEHVFMTGISNGGFMTILAATHFDDRIAAFAPVSAGDPYGTYMDMGTHPPRERLMAPGVFRDNETHELINQAGAADAKVYPHERQWHTANPAEKPAFKQFHHHGDAACDVSCMRKARRLLVEHGYKDDGPFILKDAGRSIWKHFWRREYSQPLVDFFVRVASGR